MPPRVTHAAETWTYILRSDRDLPLEQQSRFVLRPLTQAERIASVDALVQTKEDPDGGGTLTLHRTGQVARDLALRHIVSAENFPAGEPMPWPADGSLSARSTYLEMLDDEHVSELGNEVWAKSAINTAEARVLKNSLAPAATSSSGASSTTTASSTPAAPAIATPS